jgi:uncharacterized cupin superfamily protein
VTVPEAPLDATDAGRVVAGEGWFVLNARDARWIRRPGRGYNVPLTGWTAHEAETYFPQLGFAIIVLPPGEPGGMHHWEADQEDFLVLAGEPLLLVEGEERRLRPWDFVHCPPGTAHTFVGAGEGASVIVAVSSREYQTGDWGRYVPDDAARRYGASVDTETPDAGIAYGRFAPSEPTPYEDGWLPG